MKVSRYATAWFTKIIKYNLYYVVQVSRQYSVNCTTCIMELKIERDGVLWTGCCYNCNNFVKHYCSINVCTCFYHRWAFLSNCNTIHKLQFLPLSIRWSLINNCILLLLLFYQFFDHPIINSRCPRPNWNKCIQLL